MIEWIPKNYTELHRRVTKRENELLNLKQNYQKQRYALCKIRDLETNMDDSRIKALFKAENDINLELVEIANLAEHINERLDNLNKLIEKEASI